MKKNKYTLSHNTIQNIISVVLALAIGATAFLLSYSRIFYGADEMVTNFIYSNNPFEKADSRITIVALDPSWNSQDAGNREELAQAIDIVSRQNSAIIGLNMDLSQETTADADSTLTEACKNAGNIIISANAHFQNNASEKSTDDFVPIDSSMDWATHETTSVDYPYESLRNVTTVGISNAMQESADGFIRNAALVIYYQSQKLDSFSVALYKAYQDSVGKESAIPEMNSNKMLEFNNIWDTRSYQVIAFNDILSGDYDQELISEHIVLIGNYVDNTDYNIFTHFEASRKQQQILLEAAVLQALLTQRQIETVNSTVLAWVYGILFSVAYFLISQKKKYIISLIQCLVVALAISLCYILNLNGIRVLLLTPIICSVLLIVSYLLQTLLYNKMERRRMAKTLEMYVDKSIVDEISTVSPLSLNSMTERRDIAVLFVDIRGFTTLSEEMDPSEVVDILNQYFSVVYASIAAWNGTVDKFIGDAAMAIFNAPKDLDDYVFHAVCAAMDIIEGCQFLKQDLFKRYGREISVGIGINCGEAIVGNIGCLSRVDYTAIGDTVNTASRLESKAAPGQILISKSVAEALQNRSTLTSVGELTLKGKTKTITAYQVDTLDKPAAPNPKARKDFLHETALLYSKYLADKQLPQFLKGK